jgi:hypothetical protein
VEPSDEVLDAYDDLGMELIDEESERLKAEGDREGDKETLLGTVSVLSLNWLLVLISHESFCKQTDPLSLKSRNLFKRTSGQT